jgi:chromosome partitioning protein
MIISVVSQKGGVGKSSISRTLAVEFTRAGWQVLLADIDAQQTTSNRWSEKRRNVAGIIPQVTTVAFATTPLALDASHDYDLTVIDGAPHATRGTAQAAEASDLVIIPTGSSLDDLEPSVLLASELESNGIAREKIAFALYKTTSEAQQRESRETLEGYGYQVLPGAVPAKTGYIDAFDRGFCATETKYDNLNHQAGILVSAVHALVRK